MERADVQNILIYCRAADVRALDNETTYYLGRMRLLPTGPAPMMRWRKRLFGFMARNASLAADFFRIPPPIAWRSWERAWSSDPQISAPPDRRARCAERSGPRSELRRRPA